MRSFSCAVILFSALLISCSGDDPKGTDEFIESWEESPNNSAVTYWYTGEAEGRYVIVERWSDRSLTYHVDKGRVRVVGIYTLARAGEEISLNLKRENVEIVTDAF